MSLPLRFLSFALLLSLTFALRALQSKDSLQAGDEDVLECNIQVAHVLKDDLRNSTDDELYTCEVQSLVYEIPIAFTELHKKELKKPGKKKMLIKGAKLPKPEDKPFKNKHSRGDTRPAPLEETDEQPHEKPHEQLSKPGSNTMKVNKDKEPVHTTLSDGYYDEETYDDTRPTLHEDTTEPKPTKVDKDKSPVEPLDTTLLDEPLIDEMPNDDSEATESGGYYSYYPYYYYNEDQNRASHYSEDQNSDSLERNLVQRNENEIIIPPNAEVSIVPAPERRRLSAGKQRLQGKSNVLIIRVQSLDSENTLSKDELFNHILGDGRGISTGRTTNPSTLAQTYEDCSFGKMKFVAATGYDIEDGVGYVEIPEKTLGVNFRTVENMVTQAVNKKYGSVDDYDHIM